MAAGQLERDTRLMIAVLVALNALAVAAVFDLGGVLSDLGASQPVGRARCSGDERRKWKPPTKLVEGLATAVCRDGESIKREDEMQPITRRRFLQYGVGAGAALAVPWTSRIPVASAAPGGKLAKYVQPVPLPGSGIVVATPERTEPVLVHPDRDRAAAAPPAAAHAAVGVRRRLRARGPGRARSGWRSSRRPARRSR